MHCCSSTSPCIFGLSLLFSLRKLTKKIVKRKAKQDFKMNLRRTLDPRRHINQLQMVNTNENIMYLLIGGFRVRWASSD